MFPPDPLFNLYVCELPNYFLELLGKRQTGWVASSLSVTHPFNMVPRLCCGSRAAVRATATATTLTPPAVQ